MKTVIRGLMCLAQKATDGTCEDCAYFKPFTDDPDTGWCDRVAIAEDAVAMLQEQERPKTILWGKVTVPMCPYCTQLLNDDGTIHYCPRCGRKVKWDG